MKINNIEVKGIKQAVSDVRHENADHWAILLNMDNWKVYSHTWNEGVLINAGAPFVLIAIGGRSKSDVVTMAALKSIIGQIIDVRARARAEYKAGNRHCHVEDESIVEYVRTELQAAGLI